MLGKDMLKLEPNSHFGAVRHDVCPMENIKGPLPGIEMLKNSSEIDVAPQTENFVVDASAVRYVVLDISWQVLTDFTALFGDEKCKGFITLPSLFLSAVLQFSSPSAERDPRHAPSVARFLPTLPQHLSKLRSREVFAIVNLERERLLRTRGEEEINDIESSFVEFNDTIHRPSDI